MSDFAEAALAAAPSHPPASARAARLEKFKREQIVVDDLNRGVSVAEIAARLGVGEKRMRAIIRELLARRMPAPPAEFAAIQVGRLNEALLVAYSAMGDMNLKAVDRVVKIVRELDRYHGFVASGRRWTERRRACAAGEGVLGFSRALGSSQGLGPQDFADMAAEQDAMSRITADQQEEEWGDWGDEPEPLAAAAHRPAAATGDVRPEIPLEAAEKIDSAPGVATTAKAVINPDAVERNPARPAPEGSDDAATSRWGEALPSAATPDIHAGFPYARNDRAEPAAPNVRPENPAQRLENMDSAPGLATEPDACCRARSLSAPRPGQRPGPTGLHLKLDAAPSGGHPGKSGQDFENV